MSMMRVQDSWWRSSHMSKAEALPTDRASSRPGRRRIFRGAQGRAGKPRASMSGEDKLAIGLLIFFMMAACSLELYFVIHYRDINTRKDIFARGFEIYADGDQAYYGHGNIYVPLALESINVFFTQVLNGVLIWAIVKRRAYRYPLQLAVSAYVSYSVVFYLWLAHVSGYPSMPVRSGWGFFIFITPNLPWLLGHLYLAYRAFVAIQRRFQNAPDAGTSAQCQISASS